MDNGPTALQRVRFAGSVSTLYVLTLLFGWYVLHPVQYLAHTEPISLTRTQQTPHLPAAVKVVISGKPIRIVIPDSGIDLPVDEGYYNDADHSWTLSGYHAQFAMMSTAANDSGGDTFIYGHNNNNVFGALRHNTPAAGASALLYTDNGHIFAYRFDNARSLTPDDTSVLHYNGPPKLTIQTCTGSIDEWRTLFTFNFEKVMQ